MTSTAWDVLGAALVVAVASWVAIARGQRTLEVCARPTVPALLLISALLSVPAASEVHPYLVQGIFFVVLSDIAMVSEPRSTLVAIPLGLGRNRTIPASDLRFGPGTGFVLALVCLSVSHVFLAVAMVRHSTDDIGTVFGLVLVLLTVFAFGYRVIIGAQAGGGVTMAVGVAVYIVILGGMVVVGVGTGSLLIAYGSVLLALSSLALAADRFVSARPWTPIAVSVLHHLALVALVIGLVR